MYTLTLYLWIPLSLTIYLGLNIIWGTTKQYYRHFFFFKALSVQSYALAIQILDIGNGYVVAYSKGQPVNSHLEDSTFPFREGRWEFGPHMTGFSIHLSATIQPCGRYHFPFPWRKVRVNRELCLPRKSSSHHKLHWKSNKSLTIKLLW